MVRYRPGLNAFRCFALTCSFARVDDEERDPETKNLVLSQFDKVRRHARRIPFQSTPDSALKWAASNPQRAGDARQEQVEGSPAQRHRDARWQGLRVQYRHGRLFLVNNRQTARSD